MQVLDPLRENWVPHLWDFIPAPSSDWVVTLLRTSQKRPEIVSQALIASSVVVIGIYYRLLNENHGETVILFVAN